MKLLLKIVASGFVISMLSGTDAVSDTTAHHHITNAHKGSFVVEAKADKPKPELARHLNRLVDTEQVLAVINKHEKLAFDGRVPIVKEVKKKDCIQKTQGEGRIIANEPCKEPKVIRIYRALETLFALPK